MQKVIEETFLARIIDKGRVTVPIEVRDKLCLLKGDLVRLSIRKEEKREDKI